MWLILLQLAPTPNQIPSDFQREDSEAAILFAKKLQDRPQTCSWRSFCIQRSKRGGKWVYISKSREKYGPWDFRYENFPLQLENGWIICLAQCQKSPQQASYWTKKSRGIIFLLLASKSRYSSVCFYPFSAPTKPGGGRTLAAFSSNTIFLLEAKWIFFQWTAPTAPEESLPRGLLLASIDLPFADDLPNLFLVSG